VADGVVDDIGGGGTGGGSRSVCGDVCPFSFVSAEQITDIIIKDGA
jgi:hypothetical protein